MDRMCVFICPCARAVTVTHTHTRTPRVTSIREAVVLLGGVEGVGCVSEVSLK